MERIILALLVSAILTGCANHPIFNVKSSNPAYIEIDGIIVCDTTPCVITPPHYRDLFGACHDGMTSQSTLVAFPINKSDGFTQYKNIRVSCGDNKTVYFDMSAAGGVQTVPLPPR